MLRRSANLADASDQCQKLRQIREELLAVLCALVSESLPKNDKVVRKLLKAECSLLDAYTDLGNYIEVLEDTQHGRS